MHTQVIFKMQYNIHNNLKQTTATEKSWLKKEPSFSVSHFHGLSPKRTNAQILRGFHANTEVTVLPDTPTANPAKKFTA